VLVARGSVEPLCLGWEDEHYWRDPRGRHHLLFHAFHGSATHFPRPGCSNAYVHTVSLVLATGRKVTFLHEAGLLYIII
jgi:hypothetical protein